MPGAWASLSKAEFSIEGEDLLAPLRAEFPSEPPDEAARARLEARWNEFVKDARIRIGTLLKSDSLSLLLGSGASKEAGGVLIGAIPLEIEDDLLQWGVNGLRVRSWLRLFYVTVQQFGDGVTGVPRTREEIVARRDSLATASPMQANLESVLSLLYRWRSALPEGAGGRIRLDGTPPVDVRVQQIDECVNQVKLALSKRCDLPAQAFSPGGLAAHKDLLRKILTRPLNLKRANVFTLNYDALVEKAADAVGVVLLDGFVGTLRRVFRPESYDHDLYFPAETTEGRVHRLDRVLHLFKLHGSITWRSQAPDWDDPYGVEATGRYVAGEAPLIYPTPSKYGETLGMPYAELFRRFASAVVRPQSTLLVIGYGFGDEHVNAIIRQALAIPSFTLVVVDPSPPAADPAGSFLAKLRAQKDRRLWLLAGDSFGRFGKFVDVALPDLRDEEIMQRVMETHRALGGTPPSSSASD